MTMPFHKYEHYPTVDLPDRTWPDRVIDAARRNWVLGRSARRQPGARRTRWTATASAACSSCSCGSGFKEIEVGFPSASKADFDFMRELIEQDLIPDDVTIVVLMQAREHLIERTFEALEGAPRAIVHLYNSI